jgi:hypothetical protein
VDVQGLRAVVNGRRMGLGWNGVTFDPARGEIRIALARAGVTLTPGATVQVALEGLRDILGNEAPPQPPLTFTAGTPAGADGPAIEQIRFLAPVFGMQENRQIQMELSWTVNCEEHTGHLRALRDCTFAWLNDPAQAAYGSRAVQFTAQDDGADLELQLHQNAWWVDTAPVLHFDYRAEPGFVVDLQVEVLGEICTFAFLGSPQWQPQPVAGTLPGTADGNWHHASIDLRALEGKVKNFDPRILGRITLATRGQPGVKRGAKLWLDNVELARPSGNGGRIAWRTRAAAGEEGIAGYAFVLDQNPGTVPPPAASRVVNAVQVTQSSGVWWGHVRAQDAFGRWGPTRHIRIDLGNE